MRRGCTSLLIDLQSLKYAEVAELADALGSGPSSRQGSAGSSPVFGTLIRKDLRRLRRKSFFIGAEQSQHIPINQIPSMAEKTLSAIAASSRAR